MTEDATRITGILACIVAPLAGRFLAGQIARRLYEELGSVDQAALDDLLTRYAEYEPGAGDERKDDEQ